MLMLCLGMLVGIVVGILLVSVLAISAAKRDWERHDRDFSAGLRIL
jgi:hypothetical protein